MHIPHSNRRVFARCARSCATVLFLVGCAASTSALAATPPITPTVQIESGRIAGKTAQVNGVTLHEFFGIPYAAPPMGALRWKPPQPVAPWTAIRPARQFGARCMQRRIYDDMVFRDAGPSEDCLYLNVWMPEQPAKTKLPVLVYFHGGGLVAGAGSEPRYDGASLASRGIVTVTVNYRLGVFGLLALPALAKESPLHASGNYGLLDQVAALKWVRANIGQFGGDPARITIGGESSGSISVSELMASKLSRNLIAGAIGESGAAFAPITPLTKAEAEARGTAFMHKLGLDSLAALRAMPARELLQATEQVPDLYFRPDIDGDFLDATPEAIYARGEQAQVPLLLGSNSAEGSSASFLKQQSPTPQIYRAALQDIFGSKAKQALALYPGASGAEVEKSATALSGDMFIAHSTWRWMELQRKTGNAPVYFYLFAKPRPAKRDGSAGPDAGAVHSGEIEYALGNLDGNAVYAWTPADREVSRVMQGYFANFIKTGDPNGHGLPAWPAVRESAGGLLRQTLGVDTRNQVDDGARRQAFLQAFFARQHE